MELEVIKFSNKDIKNCIFNDKEKNSKVKNICKGFGN